MPPLLVLDADSLAHLAHHEQASTWCAEQGMARMAARLAGAARA